MQAFTRICEHILYMRAYTRICEHTRVYASIYAYMRAYTCICKHVRVYASIHVYMRAYTRICEHTRVYASMVISWNSCKLSVRYARTALIQLCSAIQQRKAVLCLQDVRSWGRNCGHVFGIGRLRLTLYSDIDSDCAIVVSKTLSKQRRGRGVFPGLFLRGGGWAYYCGQYSSLSIRKLVAISKF